MFFFLCSALKNCNSSMPQPKKAKGVILLPHSSHEYNHTALDTTIQDMFKITNKINCTLKVLIPFPLLTKTLLSISAPISKTKKGLGLSYLKQQKLEHLLRESGERWTEPCRSRAGTCSFLYPQIGKHQFEHALADRSNFGLLMLP